MAIDVIFQYDFLLWLAFVIKLKLLNLSYMHHFLRINFTDGTSCTSRINAWLDAPDDGDQVHCCRERSAECTSPQLLEGPSDFGGQCPSGSYEWKNDREKAYCCCAATCCVNNCRLDAPPEDCLRNVPGGASWIWNELGFFQAIKGTTG